MQILKEACPNVSVLGIFPPSVQSKSSYLPFRLFLSFRTMKIAWAASQIAELQDEEFQPDSKGMRRLGMAFEAFAVQHMRALLGGKRRSLLGLRKRGMIPLSR